VQHISFFGTAALFWWGIAHGRYGRIAYGAAVVYVFATAVHSGVLGALLTFSPRVWYAPYLTSHASGLTPLEDQQLAGLLMWVPAGLIFAMGGLGFFAAWLRESDRRTRLASLLLIATLAVGAAGCRSEDRIFSRQNKALRSLQSTAVTLGETWLSSRASTNYTRIALEQTLQLLETERGELAVSPPLLANPRGAALSQAADRLARLVALVWKAVGAGDSEAARRHLAEIAALGADMP
jgi:hypothetical protein